MGRPKESVQHHLCSVALEGLTGHTVSVYKHDIKAFAEYARENGVKSAEQFEKRIKGG